MKKVAKDIKNPKGKYVEKQEAEIDKWNDELKNLESKLEIAEIEAKTKLEHNDQIRDLRQKCDDAKKKISELQSADNETWEDLKGGLEGIWTNVSEGIKKVKSKII